MTDTLQKPAPVEETLDDSFEFQAHYVCDICYPDAFDGTAAPFTTKAVCGALLVGQEPDPSWALCNTCTEEYRPHRMEHWKAGDK